LNNYGNRQMLTDVLALTANASVARWGLAPMDLLTLIETQRFHVNEDPFDAAIVATARLLEFPLITAEASITDSNVVEIYW
jgi:PIN domain nuclease of toxin-antitoxin system